MAKERMMKISSVVRWQTLAATLAFAWGAAAQANCPVVSGLPVTTPDSAFVDTGNGTVQHVATGLIWKRCAEGQSWDGSNATCTGTATFISGWSNVLNRVDAVNNGATGTENAGFSDWRLPNIKELGSIVEQACPAPMINTTQFPAAPDVFFWSGSPVVGGGGLIWSVYFSDGNDYIGGGGRIRLVRAGPNFQKFDAATYAVPLATPVPTLSTWALALLGAGLLWFGARFLRRRG